MNNGLLSFDPAQPITMSSREIADLTGKEHRNVLRDVRALLDELNIDALSFEHTYKDASNRLQTEYALPKRETLILVSGYNVQMRAVIVDRWQELEAQASKTANPFLTASRRELLQVALEAEERAEKAQALADKRKEYISIYKENEISYQEEISAKDAVIKLATPAIKFQQTYEQTGEPLGFRAVAKNLRANEREFSSFLKDKGIMYKSKNKYVPYAGYVNTPYFCSKINYVGNLEWEFTASGFIWVSQWWAKYQAEKRISPMPKGGLFNRGAQ